MVPFTAAQSLPPAGSSPKAPAVYLHPGQIFTASEPVIVTTVLGSCIAICLWDSVAVLAGINHYLLPVNPLRGQADGRFGNTATERLVDEMLQRGATRERMVAKLFGGAAILMSSSKTRLSIGEQNLAAAHEALRSHGIRIIAEQTGGPRGRKLHFHTADGTAYVREI